MLGGFVVWLSGRKGLGGGPLEQRLNRLEAEVKRLADGETALNIEDEVHRLDEKVEFLENLLAERSRAGVLPPGDRDASGAG